MAYPRILATALAATLGLTACASPYADGLKASLSACQQGDQGACSESRQLSVADQQWHAQQNERAATVALGILAGVAAGANAYAAARQPAVVYAPVVVCRWNCW